MTERRFPDLETPITVNVCPLSVRGRPMTAESPLKRRCQKAQPSTTICGLPASSPGRNGRIPRLMGQGSRDLQRGDAGAPRDWWDGRPYDRILADVPCSASGIVRRHPDIKWLRRPTDVARFARAQEQLLDALWQTLASDGKLLYATCSVFQEENSEQIAGFLERHRDATRLSLPAVDNNSELPAGQLLPDGRHDGFFYALLQKS